MPNKQAGDDARAVIAMLLSRLSEGESLENIIDQIKIKDPAAVLPGLGRAEAKGIAMKKKAAKGTLSRLEQLDLKGVGPDMLAAIANRDTATVMQQPIMLQRQGERLERIRRLKDELKAPGSHLQPEKPKNNAQMAASGLPGSPHMPAAPGSPIPPSNLLGGFSPQHMEQAQAMMGNMPKMSSAQKAAAEMSPKAESEGAESAEEEKAEQLDPKTLQSLLNLIVEKGEGIDDEKDVHAKAEELGVNPHEAEEQIYKTLAGLLGGKNDIVAGGKASGMPTSEFPKDQIEKGVKVEMEHTPNPAVAQEIAKDHLTEFKDYYDPRLEDMEGKAKKDKPGGIKNTVNPEEEKKAYKYGFFLKVAEMGFKPDELEKQAVIGPLLAWLGLKAADKGKDEASSTAGALKDMVASGLLWPTLLAPTIGAGLGASYRHLTAPSYATPEEFQHVERLAELKKHTRAARRRARKQKG